MVRTAFYASTLAFLTVMCEVDCDERWYLDTSLGEIAQRCAQNIIHISRAKCATSRQFASVTFRHSIVLTQIWRLFVVSSLLFHFPLCPDLGSIATKRWLVTFPDPESSKNARQLRHVPSVLCDFKILSLNSILMCAVTIHQWCPYLSPSKFSSACWIGG